MAQETATPAHANSRSLEQWLAELERRHPEAIRLGLERVDAVWRALGAPAPASRVIAVGGTNGKGSTVAFLEAAATALGCRIGCYTSPHRLRYNERIRIEGAEAADAAIVDAFERIEAARGEVLLTYFEMGTLAALLLMAEASPALDIAVLEIGLGGRLDAVNIVDADVAIVTTVALDHEAWLGSTRAQIGREKAGIARAGRPFVVGEREPEQTLLDTAIAAGARLLRLGDDFDVAVDEGAWMFRWGSRRVLLPERLPLAAPCQWDNAATALAALAALPGGAAAAGSGAGVGDAPSASCRAETEAPAWWAVAAAGLADARLAGRLQRVAVGPEVVLDVGHNPQAAQALAQWLAGEGADRATDAVFSALADKDIEGIVVPLLPYIRRWHLAGLVDVSARGLTASQMAERLSRLLGSPASEADIAGQDGTVARHDANGLQPLSADAGRTVATPLTAAEGAAPVRSPPVRLMSLHDRVADALSAARKAADVNERVLVFGSFHTVAEAEKALAAGL